VVSETQAGRLTLQRDGVAVKEEKEIRDILGAQVGVALNALARGGFFAA
jgi:hypothetical protein